MEAETGPTSRCAIYDMNITKINAPMAAPMVRVTLIPFGGALRIRLPQGKGSAHPTRPQQRSVFRGLATWTSDTAPGRSDECALANTKWSFSWPTNLVDRSLVIVEQRSVRQLAKLA